MAEIGGIEKMDTSYLHINPVDEDFVKLLTKLQNFQPERIVRTSDLGKELNFSEIVPEVTCIVSLVNQIDINSLSILGENGISTLKNHLLEIHSIFGSALNFSTATSNPKGTWESIVAKFRDIASKLPGRLHPFISFSAAQRVLNNDYDSQFKDAYEKARGELAEQITAMQTKAVEALEGYIQRSDELYDQQKQKLEEAQYVISALKGEVEKTKKDAENALIEVRKSAAEAGVSQQAEYFKEAQEHHSKKATIWLVVSVGVAVVLAVVAIASIFIEIDVKDNYQLAQLIMGKVILVSTITFMLVMAIKSYNAHRHNAVVNKHRQNSLSTYRALVEAGGDQANKDLVLSKAAESIFGSQCTGFAKASGSDSDGMAIINVQQPQMKMPMDGN